MLMQESAMVLKRDVCGRVRTPSGQREALVEEFERSGLPGTQFAKLVGIKYSTLMAWVERKRKVRPNRARQPERPVFAEAVVAPADVPSVNAGALVLRLPGGATVEIKDRGQVDLVADLLKALA